MRLYVQTRVPLVADTWQLYAPLQGVLSDAKSVQIGYWVAFVGYCNAFGYGVGMCIDKERRKRIDSKTGMRLSDLNQPSYAEDTLERSDTEKFETMADEKGSPTKA